MQIQSIIIIIVHWCKNEHILNNNPSISPLLLLLLLFYIMLNGMAMCIYNVPIYG